MSERDATYVGDVRHVLGSTVTVELDPNLAGVTPIYRGRLQSVGQIGSLVRLPQGLVDLIGSVTLVGIAELTDPLPPADEASAGERWLKVQLLGEIDRGTGHFQRGVSTYPGLDDPVHFTTAEELATVFPQEGDRYIRVGSLSASDHVSVQLDAQKLVTRHCAVVGSTGAGKTSAVSSMLQQFVRGGWDGANIVVIDPHGEYAHPLDGAASVRSVLAGDDDARSLRVPYWALRASEILRIFSGETGRATVRDRFTECVTKERREFVERSNWLDLDVAAVTADTPVPFDIRSIWYSLQYENNETLQTAGDPSTACIEEEGDAGSLSPTRFTPHGPGATPPHKGPYHGTYGRVPDLLRLGLLDPKLRFLRRPSVEAADDHDPLVDVVQEWLGGIKPVSILDFSGVPAAAADVAIGVVVNLLFEVAVRCEPDGNGIGRPRPVLIVLEEAHRYLGESANPLTRAAVNRIAREGRKYGVGLLLVTQRPSELPKTALAQCGTMIALRLTNATDQGTIRAALPDTVTGLSDVLPSLRTGEAVVSGEALELPARTVIREPKPWPLGTDPPLESWRAEPHSPEIGPALAEWRGVYEEE